MRKKRILSALVSAVMALSLLPNTAFALEQESGSEYVLMDIPYEDFYRAEIGENEATVVDSVTSATKNKPRTGSLAGGSYHVNSDGTDITGVIFPVKVSEEELETLNSDGYMEVTDSSSVDITVTNRGQETTTTYSGKDALFEAPSYSYYVLDEAELKDYDCYKELEISSGGTLTFGKAQGVSTELSDASATLSVPSNYGDYQLAITDESETINSDTVVSGIMLTTDDGYSYGLRHIENLWQRTNLAFSTGFTTEVHGCPTSSEHYASIMGKTINEITYFTTNGIYEIATNLKVPKKVENTFSVVDAAVSAGTTAVTTTGLDNYDTFTCDNDGIVYASGELTWSTSEILPGTYTLTATDSTVNYAPVTTTFMLTTESDAAQYDEQNGKLVNAESTTDADFQNYLSKITTVSVNGTDYSASGYGAVAIVNSSDGTLDLTVKSGEESVFAIGVNEVKITATGYPELSFSVNKATPGGSGTAEDPYQIATAEQFNNIRNHLDAYYKLIADIDLENAEWTPIGAVTMSDFDDEGNVDPTKAFTGYLDGNGKTISNVTVNDDGTLVGVGLFGATSGTGVIENFTLKDVKVTGTQNAMAVGGLVGYAMSSGAVDNVTLTSTTQNVITGTNCIGGLVGGGTSPNNCMVEKTTINVFGDNTDSDSEYSFSSGRIVQHDVAECAGMIVGGGFGGTITGNTVKNCTINANGDTDAVEAVGLGGIGGCLQCMTSITNNTVNGLTINAPGGHAIGGLAGYAGNGNMAAYGFGTDCTISGCTVTGLTINAENATHVGGLIGTNMYYNGMEGQFDISNCSAIGTIYAGTTDASVYGASTPGAVAGHAAGCIIDNYTKTNSTVGTLEDIGMVSVMYESADQDDTKDQTNAGEQLNALIGTYQQLFQGTTFEAKYNKYWHDAAAAVVGESGADEAVQMMKASIGSETYGDEKEENAFCCNFINGVDRITFNGTEISGTLNGATVFSHPYQCIGTYDIGKSEGIEGFGGFVMQSLDANEDEFKYFLMLPDTMDSTHHIEFRYGSDLEDLQLYGSGKYANWLVAGISTSAMKETTGTIGEIDNQLRQVIALFCEENLTYDPTGAPATRSPESLSQLSDFVGIWDANDETLAVMHSYPGFENAKMYVDFKADGTAKTYVASDGVNYVVSSSYSYFAYDNSSSDKSGLYLVDSDEGVSTAPYSIVTSGGKQTISFFSADGTAAYVKRDSSSGGSGGSGSSSGSGSSGSVNYSVNVPTSISNGAVSVTPENANKGNTVTITTTPDPGFEVGSLKVTDADGNEISVTDKGDGTYTFIMPASKVNINTEFRESGTTAGTGFTDVSEYSYYKDAVNWAVEQGITSGTSATTFSPDVSCTRAQAVTFLWRANGSPEPTSVNNPFEDVSASDYYYKAVLWAVEKGITQGTTEVTFDPNATVTRAQTVTFLWRTSGKPLASSSNVFDDVSSTSYYADAVAWAVSEEITHGVTATTFGPSNSCTRAEIVTFLYRSMADK